MDLIGAIDARRSRRKYSGLPLETETAGRVRGLINEYNAAGGFRMELVTDNGEAFNGFTRSYGMFSGVKNYAGLIIDPGDGNSAEKLGYYGELLTLRAVSAGLGTCWVAGSFSKPHTPFKLKEGETLACVITLGGADEQDGFREKMLRSLTHRKSKSAEDMYESDGPVPEWFSNGMKAVMKAPSAVNRQPVKFYYKNGAVSASVINISDTTHALDFGIAKLHFEIGAGGGKWAWGCGAEFTRDIGQV